MVKALVVLISIHRTGLLSTYQICTKPINGSVRITAQSTEGDLLNLGCSVDLRGSKRRDKHVRLPSLCKIRNKYLFLFAILYNNYANFKKCVSGYFSSILNVQCCLKQL